MSRTVRKVSIPTYYRLSTCAKDQTATPSQNFLIEFSILSHRLLTVKTQIIPSHNRSRQATLLYRYMDTTSCAPRVPQQQRSYGK